MLTELKFSLYHLRCVLIGSRMESVTFEPGDPYTRAALTSQFPHSPINFNVIQRRREINRSRIDRHEAQKGMQNK